MEAKKILVADDDPKILKYLSGFLTREGYEVCAVSNGEEMVGCFDRFQPDLVILDVMMPKMDGFEACRRIREISTVPVIMLSAKGEQMSIIMGLTLGSDDYLTKPFDSAELLLRIRAVLRRTVGTQSAEGQNDTIKVPGLVIDRTTRTVKLAGEEIELTPKEFDLLWLLASHPAQVFTRDQLLYQVWDTDYSGDTGVVTTLVKRLREKIEIGTAEPRYIKTVRGVGYKFGVKPC